MIVMKQCWNLKYGKQVTKDTLQTIYGKSMSAYESRTFFRNSEKFGRETAARIYFRLIQML